MEFTTALAIAWACALPNATAQQPGKGEFMKASTVATALAVTSNTLKPIELASLFAASLDYSAFAKAVATA